MAEIHVERKKNIWPWVIALIVLVLLIWGAFAIRDNDQARTPATVEMTDPAPAQTVAPPGETVGDAAPPQVEPTTPPEP